MRKAKQVGSANHGQPPLASCSQTSLFSAGPRSCDGFAASRMLLRGAGGRRRPLGSVGGAAPGAANLMPPQAEKSTVPLHSPQGGPLTAKLLHVAPPLDLFLK